MKVSIINAKPVKDFQHRTFLAHAKAANCIQLEKNLKPNPNRHSDHQGKSSSSLPKVVSQLNTKDLHDFVGL